MNDTRAMEEERSCSTCEHVRGDSHGLVDCIANFRSDLAEERKRRESAERERDEAKRERDVAAQDADRRSCQGGWRLAQERAVALIEAKQALRAAHEVDAFLSVNGPPFRFDGKKISDDAQTALLSLHDYLNDLAALTQHPSKPLLSEQEEGVRVTKEDTRKAWEPRRSDYSQEDYERDREVRRSTQHPEGDGE